MVSLICKLLKLLKSQEIYVLENMYDGDENFKYIRIWRVANTFASHYFPINYYLKRFNMQYIPNVTLNFSSRPRIKIISPTYFI